MGMVLMARIAGRMGWSEEDCLTPLQELLKKFGFSLDVPYAARSLAEAALLDKKRKGGTIHLVVPVRIGACRLVPVPAESLEELIEMGLST